MRHSQDSRSPRLDDMFDLLIDGLDLSFTLHQVVGGELAPAYVAEPKTGMMQHVVLLFIAKTGRSSRAEMDKFASIIS
jgi:hypothetical protein